MTGRVAAIEIPREEWVEFLDSFGRQHEGWLVTVESSSAESGAQVATRQAPLRGISTDRKGASAGSITILLGGNREDRVSHRIPDASRLWFCQTPEGAHGGLEIESAGGIRTLLRFRAPIAPERLDGLPL